MFIRGVPHRFNMVMNRKHICTIDMKITTRERIKKLKIHPRQSYDEVINKAIKLLKDKE